MTDAPERIWLQWVEPYCDDNTWCEDKINDDDAEYIRADLHQQALDAAREEGRRQGLEGALVVLDELQHGGGASNFYEGWDSALATADDRIRALIDKPADPVAEALISYTPTTAQIQSVCYTMRHDYGLMTREERETLEFHATEMWKAVAKALAQKEGE